MRASPSTETFRALAEEAAGLDARYDGLADRRWFALPDDVVYLDGNSLGPPVSWLPQRLRELVEDQWSGDLIASWEQHGWWEAPARLGDKIAPIIGAHSGEVVVGDSTSVHLFNALCAACRRAASRDVILVDKDDFPTDRYMAHSIGRLLGLRVVESSYAEFPSQIQQCADSLAVVLSSTVDYRSAELRDMGLLTELVHKAGGLAIWDLSHAAGALPLDVRADGADFAVGCTYKFLSGGPGSPAYLYTSARIADQLDFPLTGWAGHAAPFDMSSVWRPHQGVRSGRIGTPSMLAMATLEAALEIFDRVALSDVREKSTSLTDFFIRAFDRLLPEGSFALASPREPAARGSHVSLRHDRAQDLVLALAAERVVVDHRQPDLLRFGFNALFNTHVEALGSVSALREIAVESST
ncbi:aminotransferase class V-fold PLP-dependent enzyme [Mycobacterium sp.]|uniref:aminotransferase class V-fold PLP-dependent enzyme n=1 Tax=Mycobacterium sp. TaxID=1785 RepID=UPI003BAC54E4